MNPEVKQEWLKALRSGDYAKTTNALHRLVNTGDQGAGYCCLGVLCDLAVKAGVTVENDKNSTYAATAVFGEPGDLSSAYLPESVTKWAGLDDGQGVLPRPVLVNSSDYVTLAQLNDYVYDNFDDIANVIEEQF